MAKRMLIDATHPEETRVVVVNGTRLEEFDVETSTKKQIKGNIYLAKVIRVEPSLQAAFVEYGGNRHGFLAFGEIHPDYYQIPVADRERLLAEQQAEFAAEQLRAQPLERADEAEAAEALEHDGESHGEGHADEPSEGGPREPANAQGEEGPAKEEGGEGREGEGEGEHESEAHHAVETMGGEDGVEESERRRRLRPTRQYKIQEVIKRRQIMLIQVVKEERGGKGAALTTYLSLAGRYCVLMPNSPRGGGVSRKITSATDRRRLKKIVGDLEIPEGMAVIVRTAGSERSKAEIKRDYEYLLRSWDSIRELTLKSSAPALIYEEANLIKRAIRDLYARDIDEILVEGDDAYRAAKDFMRMLTPSHAKKVQPYKDPSYPLLQRFQVENQLDAMHSPTAQLKSGGYVVINPTEALVSIDVNSGRATKERHIEETALKTNLEAADEIARQLRLRDLAGLIVIDFIDMEDRRNNHAVERRLKEALRHDRARIQIGKISPFGLLEMSRQRLRPSLMETSSLVCQHCGGSGHVRSVESTAVYVLRAIEEEGAKRRAAEITVHVPTQVALYILNQKRAALADIEARHQMRVLLQGDDSLIPPNYRIDRTKAAVRTDEHGRSVAPEAIQPPRELPPLSVQPDEEEGEEDDEEDEEEGEEHAAQESGEEKPRAQPRPRPEEGEGADGGKRKRRRRRRRGGRKEPGEEGYEGQRPEGRPETRHEARPHEPRPEGDEGGEEGADSETGPQEAEGERPHGADENGESRRRRRGRRGGRRRRGRHEEEGGREGGAPRDHAAQPASGDGGHPTPLETASWQPPASTAVVEERSFAERVAVEPEARPQPTPAPVRQPAPEAAVSEAAKTSEESGPARKGWWNRLLSS
jgi:ribonuclease E